LTESVILFESLDQQDKRAEAMTDLALCYWRSGAHDNARVVFRQALDIAQDPETKLRALVNASTVEISTGRYTEALSLLNTAADLLTKVSDESSHGRYHGQRALVYRNLDNLDDALVEYSAASMYFANAGHVRYLAGVENNIGFILLHLGRTAEALTHLDKARTVFLSLKDSGMVAQVNETRARVFIAQKRLADAERAVFAAVTVFEKGDDHSLLAQALMTQGIAFVGSGKYSDARRSFQRASDVAGAADDSHLAAVAQLTMIEEMRDHLASAHLLASYRSAAHYLSDRASQSELEQLRRCSRIVMDNIEHLQNVQNELVGGSLEEEKFHFEARLIKRALEQANGRVTEAARILGITHQGLCSILEGRHSNTLGRARREKRVRRKSLRKQ
jgi:tetratricopeptide (TPR) repeat protein